MSESKRYDEQREGRDGSAADEKRRRRRGKADRGSRGTGEPGGADPAAHPYDNETHPSGGGAVDDRDPDGD